MAFSSHFLFSDISPLRAGPLAGRVPEAFTIRFSRVNETDLNRNLTGATVLLNMWHWGDDRYDGFDMAGGIMMMIFWIVLIVAVVLLAVWLIRQTQTGGGAPPPPGVGGGETPLDVLAKRYARGEIDKAEYEEKKRDLSG